ncbi:ketoacyl-synt-domain-containing protein [Polyplosphaeria fusca]|uniref:Ketoacyl-synt-domain-containing protein n=1 Tax=Polyplosphaeria fusca TaxID=682080 RepID=A0A9P4QU06_9PLEO|nr:ketoacyl-synt-domain-containing protein [Polyplosphaeria fusca]
MASGSPLPIAIIGTACRFPGNASSPSKLLELLFQPRDLLKDVPRDRYAWEGTYRADGLYGASKTKAGYFLEENIRHFDAQFFNIHPAEAETMDPQQRLLLECTYEAIECSGLTLEELRGSDAGVYVGMMGCEYYDNANHDPQAASGQILSTGTSRSMASNRISYVFDFRGPSMTIDTACSSSMLAVHLGVSSLRRGESNVVFACGTNLNLATTECLSLTRMSMASPDGQSKMWDASANGYAKGEGVAVVCLKRLDEAIRDGDQIESIIRETGTNQDGHTKGITMPSATAQTDLIRKTYRNSGLDPTEASSRPMYFEAHGTGTKIGDPIEAEAIRDAFFPLDKQFAEEEVLYIGSIKTVIGHTEGTAGLAGLLKASLAVRHGFLPPNLLYSLMNPTVAPFTKHLRLVTSTQTWPENFVGRPRRASINSFGFGGSNVHIIIESYDSLHSFIAREISSRPAQLPVFTPFVFSARSKRALLSALKDYQEHLSKPKSSLSLRDLSWTLQQRRSQFPFRYSVSALSVENLRQKLAKATSGFPAEAPELKAFQFTVPHMERLEPRILGVFTGQGAQWAGMGQELVESSSFAREVFEKLDHALASLPEADRPAWMLQKELMAADADTRVNEATIAQSLTAAIQILLVDLLSSAGVKLQAVVGHSSGEIGAAYAAGLLSAQDAIRVAYYRGLHSDHAIGNRGQAGAMLVTYLTAEQAEDLCNRFEYHNSVVIAAFNSATITTLSGDADAIDLIFQELTLQNKFARRLEVDKAYHSHHMGPCTMPYLHSLVCLDPLVSGPSDEYPKWFSSVYPGRIMLADQDLRGSYWVENLVRPVKFSQAIQTAVSELPPLDLIIEIGPHPTLQQPLAQIIGDSAKNIHTTLLQRGCNSILSISESLGFVWSRLGRAAVDLTNYDKILSGGPKPQLVRDLPSYAWQHDREYWWESRLLRNRFRSTTPPNELLGYADAMGASHEHRWRRFLSSRDVPWLMEHTLHGEPVFPGAAYVVMVATAAQQLWQTRNIQMIEVKDLTWAIPIVFQNEDDPIEIILTFHNIASTSAQATAEFYVDFCGDQRADELNTAAHGKVLVRFGTDSDRFQPTQLPRRSGLSSVPLDHFYSTMADLGYGWAGPFRSLIDLERCMEFATGKIKVAKSEMIFHPALLDALFQSCFAALSFPGDSAMPGFRVPSSVSSVKIFPARYREITLSQHALAFDTQQYGFHEFAGIIRGTGGEGIIQMDGFKTSHFQTTTAADDVAMFSQIVWLPQAPDHLSLKPIFAMTPSQRQNAMLVERICFYYLRMLADSPIHLIQGSGKSMQNLCELSMWVVAEAILGLNKHVKPEWLNDADEDILALLAENLDNPNAHVANHLNDAYQMAISSQETVGSILSRDNTLIEGFQQSNGLHHTDHWISWFLQALTNRSREMHILEIGSDISTSSGLENTLYASYTCTNSSPAMLQSARNGFRGLTDKQHFRILDIEQDPLEQGFAANTYEIIIASNFLYASVDVILILQRLHSLLRPGGFLICSEISTNTCMGTMFSLAAHEDWWRERETNSTWTPGLTEAQWNSHLKASGFSGIELITPGRNNFPCPYRVFYSQALNEEVMKFREPLHHNTVKCTEGVLIVGGDHQLCSKVIEHLAPSFSTISQVTTFDAINDTTVPHTVVCLVELDAPLFKTMDSLKFAALKKLFTEATDVLWVTKGRKAATDLDTAYMQMMVGLGRTVGREIRDLRLAFLDVDRINSETADNLSESLLRWQMQGHCFIQGISKDTLFPPPTELAIENGRFLSPYIVNVSSANDRYNSQHRQIHRDAKTLSTPIEVLYRYDSSGKAQYIFQEISHSLEHAPDKGEVQVRMRYSTTISITAGKAGYFAIGIGMLRDGTHAILFAESNKSQMRIPRYATRPYNPGILRWECLLRAFAANIVAERALNMMRPRGNLLLFSSDALIMTLIQIKASAIDRKVEFITSEPSFELHRAAFIDKDCLELTLRSAIPKDTNVVINISGRPEDKILFERVCSMVSNSTITRDADTIFQHYSSSYDSIDLSDAQWESMLSKYCASFEKISPDVYKSTEVVTVHAKDIAGSSMLPSEAIIDWTVDEDIPVSIQCADLAVQFKPDKTYLVVGTSDIAQSLVEWMICAGAKFIILASRNPSSLANWAEDQSRDGVFVHLHALDVTDAHSIRDMILEAKAGKNRGNIVMPSIGGVIHLAVVLRDAAFANMSFEDFQMVVDVKAKGCLNLHEVFEDEGLDFFVMTASIAYILGNPGQANYNAGNAFMVGLANYRRSIGLPASVVHLGRVTGMGLITRDARSSTTNASQALLSTNLSVEDLRKMALYPISERDLIQIFAEAILASSPESGMNPEIITGLRNIDSDMLTRLPFAKYPLFAQIHVPSSKSTSVQSAPLRETVNERGSTRPSSPSTTPEAAEGKLYQSIRTSFLKRLGALLRSDMKDTDDEVSLLNLGIDSLISSDIVSWAKKELDVRLPQTLVFGGGSIKELLQWVVGEVNKRQAMKNLE